MSVERGPSSVTERPMSFLGAAGWTLLVGLLYGIAVGFLEASHPGAQFDLVTVTASKLLAYGLVLFAILRVHAPEGSIRHLLALRAPRASYLLLALVVGAALSPAASFLDGVFAARFPPSPAETELLDRLFAAPTPARRAVVVAVVAFVVPVWDELFFRGALFTSLEHGRARGAVILATAAYDTLSGASARGLVAMLVLALALSAMRGLTGSVIVSIAARVAFFAVSVAPLALGREDPEFSLRVAVACVGVAALAFAALAAVSRRAPRTAEAQLDGLVWSRRRAVRPST